MTLLSLWEGEEDLAAMSPVSVIAGAGASGTSLLRAGPTPGHFYNASPYLQCPFTAMLSVLCNQFSLIIACLLLCSPRFHFLVTDVTKALSQRRFLFNDLLH